MFTVEAILVLLSGWYLFQTSKGSEKLSEIVPHSRLALVLWGALGLAAAGLMLHVDRSPHGDWDGFAIWNTHARFLFRDGPNWRNDIQYSFHNDYPLFTPAATARFWRYAGEEVPEAGALPGIILGMSGLAVLGIMLRHFRDSLTSTILVLSLLATPFYLEHTTSQYADVPLSFFVLSTIALICVYDEFNDWRILALAGFTTGCAGWTKNEGLLFIVVACVAILVSSLRLRRKTLQLLVPFCLGLVLPLIAILIFKSTILGRNEVIELQNNTMGKILDWNRYVVIARNYGTVFANFGGWTISPLIPLLLFIFSRGIDRKVFRNFGWTTGVLIVAILLAGYFFVYVVTPHDLNYHLGSSLDRLYLHVWPSLLLLTGLLRSDLRERTSIHLQEGVNESA